MSTKLTQHQYETIKRIIKSSYTQDYVTGKEFATEVMGFIVEELGLLPVDHEILPANVEINTESKS